MGLFKSLGKKLKRVVSFKNLTNIVAGKFGAVGADIVRVATTADPRSTPEQQSQEYIAPAFQIPQTAIDVADYKYSQAKEKFLGKASENTIVQNISSSATSLYIKSMWFKYKNWLIGLLAAIILFIIVRKVWRNRPKSRTRAR